MTLESASYPRHRFPAEIIRHAVWLYHVFSLRDHHGLYRCPSRRWRRSLCSGRLNQMPQVSADDRAKLVDGATQSLDSTRRHLVDDNCQILLQSHFDEGAS